MATNEIQKKAENLNQDFLAKRDKRVSKPHINVVPENLSKHLVFPNNWVLNSDHAEIMMDKPNDIALYSNLAVSTLNEANQIYKEQLFADKNPMRFLKPHENPLFYNYFEKITASVIFAYTSIESLANIFIPNDYSIEITEKSGVVKIWSKSAIERTYTLRDKLKVVLKDSIKTSEPEKEKWWQLFISLEDIRNELIHVKPSKSEERFSKLLSASIFDTVMIHSEIISYYGRYINELGGDAINKFPYGFNNDNIKPYSMSEENFDKSWKKLNNIPD